MMSRLVIGGLVVAIVTGYLMLSGFSAGRVYYHTVEDFVAQPTVGEFVRVSGVVEAGSIDWRPTDVALAFTMVGENGEARLPIRYDKVKPDLFDEDVPVVVEGRLGADGVFTAERVLVQCPSKYEAASDA